MATGDTRVITASRGKLVLLCLGAIAFSALGGWLVYENASAREVFWGWAVLVFFGFAGMVSLAQLVWPSRLVFDANGIVFQYLLMTYRRRWADMARIDVVQIRSTRIVKLIAKPGGKDLALGGVWSVSTDELTSLVQSYLERFGRTNAT